MRAHEGRMPASAARVIGTVVVTLSVALALTGTVIFMTGFEAAFLLIIIAVALLVTGIGILCLDDER